MKDLPLSLRVFGIHTALTATSLLILASPLSDRPGPIHPFLVIPFFYVLLSGLPYIAVLLRGAYELQRGIGKLSSALAVGASLLILSAMGCWVAHMWPLWMGI